MLPPDQALSCMLLLCCRHSCQRSEPVQDRKPGLPFDPRQEGDQSIDAMLGGLEVRDAASCLASRRTLLHGAAKSGSRMRQAEPAATRADCRNRDWPTTRNCGES